MRTSTHRWLVIAAVLVVAGCILQAVQSFQKWMDTLDFEIRPDHRVPNPADLKIAMLTFYAWSIAAVAAVLIAALAALLPLLRKLRARPPRTDGPAVWH